MTNKNPFSLNRAEYMRDLWKYYVPFKDFPDSIEKPVIVVGGRGTGKSMFFLCNSWREKYASLEGTSDTPIVDFLKSKQIGVYYKVDNTFVSAMNSASSDKCNWDGCFNTYLSISLLIELFPLIQVLYENNVISDRETNNVVSTYFKVVRGENRISASTADAINDCFAVLQEIEDLINCISETAATFRQTQPGTIFKAIIDELHTIEQLSDVVIKVYLDEYEAFSEQQQKIVNTLVKQSDRFLVYNIGMRHNGMKTSETLGENEILQATHDYQIFNFDDLLVGKEYENALRNICEKRLQMFFDQNNLSSKALSTDIEFYLSRYDSAKELERFEKRTFKFKTKLKTLIKEQCTNEDNIEAMVDVLCEDLPILNARLHLALLLRADYFRPTINELYIAYSAWKDGKTDEWARKYQSWLHNAKNGLIFLLAKECGLSKWYYGFDAFVALSSGVVRYFLELCEQTFNIAVLDGFSWEEPKAISSDIQTRAAKYISQNKVNEIASYPVYGKQLRIFVQYFGEICRDLHRNENSTLGEPEVNHFTTEALQLSAGVEKHLNNAVTCLVLQKLPQTKSKENFRTDISDYHLNKIYAPYFEISYNKKRKVKLSVEQLEQLFSADVEVANKTAKTFLDEYWGRKTRNVQPRKSEKQVEQLNLFGEGNYK